MAVKKLDFVGNHRFVRGPVVNIEVIDTRIDADLALRGSLRCLNRRSRLRNLIVRSDANQPGPVKRSCMLDRGIWRTQQPGRGATVPPSGFVADSDDAAPTDLGPGRANERWL